MIDAERLRLGEERKLIFRNFCNGVPIDELCAPFRRSRAELEREIFFVAKKIREYRFRRCTDGSKFAAPPVQSETLSDIRINRRAMMETLGRLGPSYLSSELLIPKVTIQKIDHPEMVREASHRLKHSRSQ